MRNGTSEGAFLDHVAGGLQRVEANNWGLGFQGLDGARSNGHAIVIGDDKVDFASVFANPGFHEDLGLGVAPRSAVSVFGRGLLEHFGFKAVFGGNRVHRLNAAFGAVDGFGVAIFSDENDVAKFSIGNVGGEIEFGAATAGC